MKIDLMILLQNDVWLGRKALSQPWTLRKVFFLSFSFSFFVFPFFWHIFVNKKTADDFIFNNKSCGLKFNIISLIFSQ